jgi:hypothetical protein
MAELSTKTDEIYHHTDMILRFFLEVKIAARLDYFPYPELIGSSTNRP